LIKVENLTKHYGAIEALNNVSFEVAQREVIGFLGPNGAGKSTTLRIVAGYLAATSGRVTVGGHDVFAKPEAVKELIGYLPENVPLYPEMRVEEYLAYRASLKRVSRAKRVKAVDGALERCKIGDVRHRIIGQLSKGYRQRVGLADALVGDPELLVLDEPTIGLDPNQIRQVRDLVRELGRERTVILSSHILPEVEAVCSRVLIIHKGRLKGQGKPEELRADLQGGGISISVEVLDPDGVAESALKELEDVDSVTVAEQAGEGPRKLIVKAARDKSIRERIFDAAVDKGFKLVGLSSSPASLEEIFLQITTREDPEDESDTNSVQGGASK
jgi:ABC-2 type transport system ATP-binding protein